MLPLIGRMLRRNNSIQAGLEDGDHFSRRARLGNWYVVVVERHISIWRHFKYPVAEINDEIFVRDLLICYGKALVHWQIGSLRVEIFHGR
jgi:hypothetical protein